MWRTLAFGLALIAVASQVKAGSPEECAKFRQTILEMEKTSVRPPGWVMFDTQLRTMYAQKCLLSPTRARAAEYWYRADGTPLGIPGDYAPPEQGGYTTTPEIAAYCANSTNPSLCALAKGIEAACANPVDTQERNYCAGILAGQVPTLPQPSEPLPRIADRLAPPPRSLPTRNSGPTPAFRGCAPRPTPTSTPAPSGGRI